MPTLLAERVGTSRRYRLTAGGVRLGALLGQDPHSSAGADLRRPIAHPRHRAASIPAPSKRHCAPLMMLSTISATPWASLPPDLSAIPSADNSHANNQLRPKFAQNPQFRRVRQLKRAGTPSDRSGRPLEKGDRLTLGDSLASAAYRTILAPSPLNTPGSRAGRPSTRSASSRVTGGVLDTLQEVTH